MVIACHATTRPGFLEARHLRRSGRQNSEADSHGIRASGACLRNPVHRSPRVSAPPPWGREEKRFEEAEPYLAREFRSVGRFSNRQIRPGQTSGRYPDAERWLPWADWKPILGRVGARWSIPGNDAASWQAARGRGTLRDRLGRRVTAEWSQSAGRIHETVVRFVLSGYLPRLSLSLLRATGSVPPARFPRRGSPLD